MFPTIYIYIYATLLHLIFVEYYAAIKSEMLSLALICTSLKNSMLSEKSQAQKNTTHSEIIKANLSEVECNSSDHMLIRRWKENS